MLEDNPCGYGSHRRRRDARPVALRPRSSKEGAGIGGTPPGTCTKGAEILLDGGEVMWGVRGQMGVPRENQGEQGKSALPLPRRGLDKGGALDLGRSDDFGQTINISHPFPHL